MNPDFVTQAECQQLLVAFPNLQHLNWRVKMHYVDDIDM